MGCFECWLVGLGSLVAPCGWCCGTTSRLTHELARHGCTNSLRHTGNLVLAIVWQVLGAVHCKTPPTKIRPQRGLGRWGRK